MSAYPAVSRPYSRRAILALVWAAAFIILGLVGLRLHSAEATTADTPVAVEAPVLAGNSTISTAPQLGPQITHHEASPSSLTQSWHVDLVTICVLTMLATMLLVALFSRRPWLQQSLGRLRELAPSRPRGPTRQPPLLLLLSISRT